VKSPSRFAVAFVAILVGFFQTPVFAHATAKPSAKVIETAMLSALKAQKSVQTQFVTKQIGQSMTGIQWASPSAALQSTNYLNESQHNMLIGKRLWVNDNAAGLQAMFNATTAEANQWQNTWIEVPITNSHYRFIVSGLKGKSFFAGFVPTGKVKVFGPKHLNGKTVLELVGKTPKATGLGGYPMAVVVSSQAPYLPVGSLVTVTVGGHKFTSTLKVTGYNTKAPVKIAPPSSAVAYNLTGMPG
jgi:hypothetical protein